MSDAGNIGFEHNGNNFISAILNYDNCRENAAESAGQIDSAGEGTGKSVQQRKSVLQHVKEITVKVDNGRQRGPELDGKDPFEVYEQMKKLPAIHNNQLSALDRSLRNEEYFQKVVCCGKYTFIVSACK